MKTYNRIKNQAGFVARCEQGVAYIEFALCIGVLVIMFIGAIEMSRYILIVQKVEKTIDTLTDVFTQSQSPSISTSQITDYLNATSLLMSPYAVGNQGLVIFTDAFADIGGDPPTVQWQVCGGGTMAATSQVAASSAAGTPVVLTSIPGGYTMNPGEEVIIGEIFYQFTPILAQNVVSPAVIYRVALFKPRFQSQITATSNCG